MIFLKVLGILLAVIAVLITVLLLIRVKIVISYDPEKGLEYYARYLSFDIGRDKKKKKLFDVTGWLKKKLGLELPEAENMTDEEILRKGIYEKVATVVLLITLLADEFVWIIKKLRLDKLRIIAVCSGEDAAESATDYGLVCAAVYPVIGYITASVNSKENAEEVEIGCDFDGNGYFEFNLTVSVKAIHVIRAIYNALIDVAEVAEETSVDAKKA